MGSGIVRDILSEGQNMWIGTNFGLVFYNGKRFKTFTLTDGLPSNTINKIVRSQREKYGLQQIME